MSGARRRRERTRDARPQPARGDAISVREYLATSSRDVAYLAVKDEMGEPLSPEERALLDDSRRSGSDPKRVGGAP